MATVNRTILLAARPEGVPKESDFRLAEQPVPNPAKDQFLVKINYLSVDPYMRGRISEAKSYAEPVGVGEVMVGGTVGTVVESRHPDYRPGDVVVGMLPGSVVTKVRPAVVIASETYLRERPDVLVGIRTTKIPALHAVHYLLA